jgi:hypothetical protein
MGTRSLISIATLAGVGVGVGVGVGAGCSKSQPDPVAPRPAAAAPAAPASLPEKVVADFEAAILSGPAAFEALFDFAAVGEMEILLHRYDLNGRLVNLDEKQKAEFAAEDGTPYPADRERRNVGNFYNGLGKRTIGTGGCTAGEPRTRYGKLLASYPPLPEGTPPKYETLRTHANEWLAKGGVVGIKCRGGRGGLALVYTQKDTPRGYDLITIYDD